MAYDISSKSVKAKSPASDDHFQAKPVIVALRSASARGVKHATLATEIAESDMFSRNFRFKDAAVYFPNHPTWRTVEKYYPNAKGGPLLVDEPVGKSDEAACEAKAPILKKLGYRYLVLKTDTDEFAARQSLGQI